MLRSCTYCNTSPETTAFDLAISLSAEQENEYEHLLVIILSPFTIHIFKISLFLLLTSHSCIVEQVHSDFAIVLESVLFCQKHFASTKCPSAYSASFCQLWECKTKTAKCSALSAVAKFTPRPLSLRSEWKYSSLCHTTMNPTLCMLIHCGSHS